MAKRYTYIEIKKKLIWSLNRLKIFDSKCMLFVQVQPIAELCELSRRRAADGGGDVELSDSNVRGGTLSRSGSRRFTSTQVSGI